jgi:hypothetical protein
MSLPANDTLIAGSTQAIDVYSANWTQFSAATANYLASTSGGLGSSSSDEGATWNADAFPNDQYAQAVANGGLTGAWNGVCVRSDTAGNNLYQFRFNQGDSLWQVRKIVGGSATNLSGTNAGTFVNGDVIKLTIVGITLTAYQNGSVLYTTTDNSIASGRAGVNGIGVASNGGFIKNWQAGSAATVAVAWLTA